MQTDAFQAFRGAYPFAATFCPTFSAKYLLRGNDEQKVREVFTHEVLAFFETQEGVSTEGDGDQLIFYRGRKRIKPENVRAFMEEGLQVLRLFKQ